MSRYNTQVSRAVVGPGKARAELTERAWQDYLVSVARLCGWRVSHFGGGWSSRGYRTPCRYDGQGFPDLVMVHPRRKIILFVEVKTTKGKLSEEQERWRSDLVESGAEYRLWRPEDEAQAVNELSEGRVR